MRGWTRRFVSGLVLTALIVPALAFGQEKEKTPLIPRRAFFGNPEKARPRLSPDGKQLAFVAPVKGVLNVWVGPASDPAAAKPITKDTHRGIVEYFWAYTSQHVLYKQDKDGDEDSHVYSVNLATNEIKDLTPIEKISAEIQEVSERFPEEILVGINDRGGREYHDIYKINVITGVKKLVQENPGVAGYMTDDDYKIRFSQDFTEDGGQIYKLPDGKDFLKIGFLDAMTTHAVAFNKTGDTMYLLDSRERNTSALTAIDLKTGKEKVLAEDPRADTADVLMHPTEKTIQAVSFTYARSEWKVLDPAVEADFAYLRKVADGEIQITGRTLDDNAHIMLRFAGGTKGMLWASQVAPGNENALRLRVYGDKGGLTWAQEDPNYLHFAPYGEAPQLIRRGGAGADAAAARVTRIPAGHPEGYLEGFATIYSDAAELIWAKLENRAPNPDATLVPSVADGVAGVAFIEAVVASSRKNGAWTKVGA